MTHKMLALVMVFALILVVCGPAPAAQAPAPAIPATQAQEIQEPTAITTESALVAIFSDSLQNNRLVWAGTEDQFIVAADIYGVIKIYVAEGWTAEVHSYDGQKQTFSTGNWEIDGEGFISVFAIVQRAESN